MTKTLEEIYVDSQRRGENWEGVIQALPKMSDMVFEIRRRQEMKDLWRSKKIHGWIDQKGRIHYPE